MKMLKIIFAITILLIVAISFASVSLAQELTFERSEKKAEILSKTNTERVQAGISQLVENEQLSQAAQQKAEDMVKNNYFSHTSPSGVSPWQWFYEAGYQPKLAGENLALSYSLYADIVKSWMKSPAHKKNLINENFTEIGIGVAKGKYAGRDAYYIVQMFGKPGAK